MIKKFFSIFGKNNNKDTQDKAEFDIDEYVKEMESRTGTEDRADALSAWALIPYSPYETWDHAASWLGGLPKAPPDTLWPRDYGGTPQHFIAQIGLESLKPEPGTGNWPPGLPREGSILMFGGESYSFYLVSAVDMTDAVPLAPPDDLPPLSSQGYFLEETTFPRWPVTPIAYLDSTGGRPAFMPDPFAKPENWIVNCGIAAFEADMVIQEIERELRFGSEFFETLQSSVAITSGNDVIRNKSLHYRFMNDNASDLLRRLINWRDYALSCNPLDVIDHDKIEKIFLERSNFSEKLQNFHIKYTIKSNPNDVILKLLESNCKLIQEKYEINVSVFEKKNFEYLSLEYHPLAEMFVKNWRGHRLFGLEPPPPFNDEDLRGSDCFLTIDSDRLLSTNTEHFSGLSIWCRRERMAAGKFDGGQLLRHFNG